MKIVIVSNKEWHRHIAVDVAAETGASVMYLTQRDRSIQGGVERPARTRILRGASLGCGGCSAL